MSRTEYDFSGVPARALSDLRLSATHWRALATVSYYDRFSRNGRGCFVSQSRLASEARMSRETFNRRLRDLVDWGYVAFLTGGQGKKAELQVIHHVTDRSQDDGATCDQTVTDSPPTCDHGGHTEDIPLKGSKKFSETDPAGSPAIPYAEIVKAFHEALPRNGKVKGWPTRRRAALQKLWRSDRKRQCLDYWQRFFRYVASECPFLIGDVVGSRGTPFFASFDWLINEDNFYPVIEGQYEQSRPVPQRRRELGTERQWDDPMARAI